MPAFCPVLGRTRAEAQAKFDEFQELIDPLAGLGSLYPTFGDLSEARGPLQPGIMAQIPVDKSNKINRVVALHDAVSWRGTDARIRTNLKN